MARVVEWINMKAPELRRVAENDAIVIVPIGSIEQHGPHLPTQVDALLATEVAVRAARLLIEKQQVVVAPTVWSGLAEHHMVLGGTITLDMAALRALLHGICRSLGRQGFRRIFLLNGHGGNVAALTVIVGELTQELGLPIGTGTYWILAEEAFANILEHQPNVCHACEAETSMLLAVRPDLVDREAMKNVAAPISGLGSEDGTYFWHPVTHWSSSGVIGAPQAATAEKGHKLLASASESLARILVGKSLWKPFRPAEAST